MSYFSSLSSYKDTQKAVAQHTTDMEESVKDAKAEASQKAYEGYSQLLDSAGGSTTGLAGGFHLTRKIYKKYQTAKKGIQDAKQMATDKVSELKKSNLQDDKDAEDSLEPADAEYGTTAEQESKVDTSGDLGSSKSTEVNTQADDIDSERQAENGIGEPEDYDLKSTNMEAPETDSVPTQTEAPKSGTKTVDNTQGNDTINDMKEADQEDAGTGAVKEGQFSRQELGGDNSAQGGVQDTSDTFGGDIGSLQEPTTISRTGENTTGLGPEPDAVKTDTDQLLGTDKTYEKAPDPPDPATSVKADPVKTGPDSVDPPANPSELSASDRLEQGANALKDTVPTPEGGIAGSGITEEAVSGGISDVSSGISSIGSSVLEGVSTGLDFLGPVGELVGAGIALGGFFHSLFDGGEKSKENTEESSQTDMSEGGGISATSLKNASNTTNLVGTTY